MPLAAGLYYALSTNHPRPGPGPQPPAPEEQPPLLLIHGAGSSHLCWPAEFRRAAGYRVLAVDLPGHGRSQEVALQSIEAYTNRLVEFLDELKLYKVILVGHSMGGLIALQFTLDNPDRIAGLGMVASGACLDIDPELRQYFSSAASLAVGYQQLEKLLFGPTASKALIQQTMQELRGARPGVLYNDWLACGRYDARERVSTVQAPTWVAAGSLDRIAPLSAAHHLAAHIPDVCLQIVHTGGHMLLLEEPATLQRGLLAFLGYLRNRDYPAWLKRASSSV